MFIHYRTRGLILKKEDRAEADQLFTIFTKDLGKVEILGKAIRKISSKLKSGAELFYLSEIEFIQGKTYKTLTDAILINKFENLRQNLGKLKIAYKIAEVFDELIKGQEKEEILWNLLIETFNKLNTEYKTADTTGKIYYYFFWNLLSILGYQPELHHCLICHQKLKPEKLYFSPKEGGIICHLCKKSLKSIKPRSQIEIRTGGKEIRPETIKILRIILKKDWPLLLKLKSEKSYLKSLNVISKEYYSYIRNNS